jgi:hypothetical protein
MKAVCCIIAGMKKDLEQHAFRAIVDQFIHEDEGDDIYESCLNCSFSLGRSKPRHPGSSFLPRTNALELSWASLSDSPELM